MYAHQMAFLADGIPPSNKVKVMVKEDVVELLEKDKRKCDVVISNLEEDHDTASDVNDESGVVFISRCLTGW